MPENETVSHEKNHAKDVAEFIQANERLADPTQRRDYFNQLDEDGFIDLVQQAASVVRTGDANARQHFDGSLVTLMGTEVPDQREKEDLLRKTWAVARGYLDDNQIPDQDALDYAALTVAGGVLLAHPFVDGNGRTTRVTSYMISQGTANPEVLHDIIANTNGGGHWNVKPDQITATEKQVYKGDQPDRVEWDDVFFGSNEDALGGTIANSVHDEAILRQMIEDHGEHIKAQLEKSVHQNENGETVLDGQKFVEELVTDPEAGITNARELRAIHRELRADYVERFLKAMQFKTPFEAHKLMVIANMDPNDLNDEFLRKRTLTARREIGQRAIDGKLRIIDRQLVRHKAHSTVRQVADDHPSSTAA